MDEGDVETNKLAFQPIGVGLFQLLFIFSWRVLNENVRKQPFSRLP